MTESINDILPREDIDPNVTKILLKFSSEIEEVVNFGTHILKWDVNESTGSDENLPIVMMFRHILELADSISILIKQSSVDPCKILLRGMLETFFSMEYILQSNSKNRALAFMVWHFHHELKLLTKLKPGEDANKQLLQKFNADKSIPSGSKPVIIPEIDSKIDLLNKILSNPLYIEVEEEYQSLLTSGLKNPPWYRMFNGFKNIEQLAQHLNRQALYEVLYRGWSGPTHGTDIIQGKLSSTGDGHLEIVQLRSLKDAQIVTQYTFTLCLLTYRLIIDSRLQIHNEEYTNWYKKIRDFYFRLGGDAMFKFE